jgi:hypothetical protein
MKAELTLKAQYARALARAQTADVHDAARAWLCLIEFIDQNFWVDGSQIILALKLRGEAVALLRSLIDQLAQNEAGHESRSKQEIEAIRNEIERALAVSAIRRNEAETASFEDGFLAGSAWQLLRDLEQFGAQKSPRPKVRTWTRGTQSANKRNETRPTMSKSEHEINNEMLEAIADALAKCPQRNWPELSAFEDGFLAGAAWQLTRDLERIGPIGDQLRALANSAAASGSTAEEFIAAVQPRQKPLGEPTCYKYPEET